MNPLICPKCQGEMLKIRRGGKIIAVIEHRYQPEVVEKILRHCDLWIEPEPRGPPALTLATAEIDFVLEPECIPGEFLANHA